MTDYLASHFSDFRPGGIGNYTEFWRRPVVQQTTGRLNQVLAAVAYGQNVVYILLSDVLYNEFRTGRPT